MASQAAASGGSSEVHSAAQEVERCLEEYNSLVSQQQEAAASLQELLQGGTGSIGMIKNTGHRVHSFKAAISSAKSPGYFSYYKSPPEIIAAEHEQELEARTAAVTAAQVKVDEAKAALERARERKRKAHIAAATAGTQSAGSSLDAWFEAYGRPSGTAGGEGYRTQFKRSTKMFGGSKHYPAFKSEATTMQVGRMFT